MAQQQPRIAVLLPCYNEEAAIAETVAGFRAALPDAIVYVYDNNSRDRTREVAAKAGAIVRSERQQGKGHVVRRMFADVDADIYVMADGDLTYDPKAAPAMVDLLVADELDMVVGTRKHDEKDAYRGGHVLGNKVFTGLLAGLYRRERPVLFFGSIGALLVAAAILLSIPLVITYLHTGPVPRFPTAILVTGMTIVAVLCFFAGLIIDTVTRGRRGVRRLAYTALPAPT